MASLQDALDLFFPGGHVTEVHHQAEGGFVEQGIDVGLPTGAAVRAVRGGTYRPELSTDYQEVIDTGRGFDSYTHVDRAAQLGPRPVYVAAGSVVGAVSGITGDNITRVNGAGGTIKYHSGGPHVEYGNYATGPDAAYFRNGRDPGPVLQAVAAGGSAAAGVAGTVGTWAGPNMTPGRLAALLGAVALIILLVKD